MFTLTSFDDIAGIAHGIETTNPCMVERIRRAADSMGRHEIAARLGQAITEATDAAHARDFAIVDCEYYDDLAAAWSLVASEHQLIVPHSIFAHDGSVH